MTITTSQQHSASAYNFLKTSREYIFFVALMSARHIFTSYSCTFIPIPWVISGQNISTFIPSTMTKLSIYSFYPGAYFMLCPFLERCCILHTFVLIFKIRLIRLNAQFRERGMALNEEILFIIYNLFISASFL